MNGTPVPSPPASRFRSLLKDVAFVLAAFGVYVLMSMVVLPRLGFQT